MNILITSAGRRGYIVEYFKDALNGDGLVYVGNSTPISVAACHGDRFVLTPSIYEKNYIPFLINYCVKEKIGIIISLFDIDLLVLSKNRDEFEKNGIKLIVSDESVITICNDKWKTYQFCIDNNIDCPWSSLDMGEVIERARLNEITYPIIVKPRCGMGSIGIHVAYDELELQALTQICKRDIDNTYLKYEGSLDVDNAVIYQEMISGQEYGIDIINDLDGNYVNCAVRKKIAMRAGETDSAVLIKDQEFDEFAKNIGERLRHIANMDIDVIVREGKMYLIEMNARFGGGYPFSHMAGINLPKAIVKWMKGENPNNELVIEHYDSIYLKEISILKLEYKEE